MCRKPNLFLRGQLKGKKKITTQQALLAKSLADSVAAFLTQTNRTLCCNVSKCKLTLKW